MKTGESRLLLSFGRGGGEERIYIHGANRNSIIQYARYSSWDSHCLEGRIRRDGFGGRRVVYAHVSNSYIWLQGKRWVPQRLMIKEWCTDMSSWSSGKRRKYRLKFHCYSIHNLLLWDDVPWGLGRNLHSRGRQENGGHGKRILSWWAGSCIHRSLPLSAYSDT